VEPGLCGKVIAARTCEEWDGFVCEACTGVRRWYTCW
jgi:hypothetical protein